ncbi:hypothetical protein AR687_24585 [Flavobacteriaceae bacterium CRH]|nr:hypothetical protein AR687_24585 [Flavobacteriaceae bacterium CRH]
MKKVLYLFLLLLCTKLQAQQKTKDTLFFKLDNSYISETKHTANKFVLKDVNSDEEFYFEGIEVLNDLKTNKVLCLKKIVRSPRFYNANKKQKLNNKELVNYFVSYTVFLVRKQKGKTEYIKVNPIVAIYD